jgi:hypothetical protein
MRLVWSRNDDQVDFALHRSEPGGRSSRNNSRRRRSRTIVRIDQPYLPEFRPMPRQGLHVKGARDRSATDQCNIPRYRLPHIY